MPETVRLVSDGEEMVVTEGEAFRIHSQPDTRHVAHERKSEAAAPPRIAIQYQGFQDAPGRREYALDAQRGDQRRRYTVWIEQAAFAARRALLQDGPDICYQKLLREVATSQLEGADCMGVTDGELAAYRDAHARPVRRGFSPFPTAKPEATTPPSEPTGTGAEPA
jgi:hypothetical protein